jgi:hypothetical protein
MSHCENNQVRKVRQKMNVSYDVGTDIVLRNPPYIVDVLSVTQHSFQGRKNNLDVHVVTYSVPTI